MYVFQKNIFFQNTSCFGFYSKHSFPLIIVSLLVSLLITATESPCSFTTKLPSGSFLLSWNIVILLSPVNGRRTFHGRGQAELLIKCTGTQRVQAK